MAQFGDYQNDIYLAGLEGRLPRFPMTFKELEAKAHAALPQSLVSYIAGGCGNERTQQINVQAFDKWGFVPARWWARNTAICPLTSLELNCPVRFS